MFHTPEIFLQAEIAYRRDSIRSAVVGTPVQRRGHGWRRVRRENASSRRRHTAVSHAH